MFFCVHKSANGVLLCTQLDFLYTQEYIMECYAHESTRHILLWELWKHSLSVLIFSFLTSALSSLTTKACFRKQASLSQSTLAPGYDFKQNKQANNFLYLSYNKTLLLVTARFLG